MMNRPKQQESQGRLSSNSSRRSLTPPWLWLLLIGGLALIFWQFVPRTEIQVNDQFEVRSQGTFIKSPVERRNEEKVARAEQAILRALELCREMAENVALPQEQRERLERAISEFEVLLRSLQQPE